MKVTFAVLAIALLKEVVLAIDYCQAGLCKANAKHVGCGKTDNFGPNCPKERSLLPMTAELKAYLLKKHNAARSDLANGKIPGYKSANRMIEMAWDNELAKLAEYNAKSCTYGHDECRNTAEYKYAGQNIAIVMSTPNYFETLRAIDFLFGLWFEEYKDCDMTYINKYRSSDNPKKQIGHFTQIVSAGANRMGCAITTYADSRKNVYIVCNYSLTNIKDRPIYTTGIPCSACTTKCSTTYPGLCDSSEVIPLK
ncbi:Antigen 5 like allergen Cul n 1 [Pseudolycoriella hygida]|uniref:Venom allergen-1 n=1 Tax=Pseudolycoriella hygida TaxID=35572 RepID=A0A9Q0NDR0_9DIPT|nr:Antigen 5 like allergen Cul n 1 [Pseudolycoriella hygida]